MIALKLPTLVAHRGYASKYPENTLLALQAAVEAGATFVEFDVQLCRDQVPVLLHDIDLWRTGGDRARIWDIDSTDLLQLPVGEPDRFGTRFSDVCAPALYDVVAWWQPLSSVYAFVELKNESLQRFGIEPMLKTVLEILEPVRERSIIISCDIGLVASARRYAELSVGWIVPAWNEHSRQMATESSPDYLFCNWKRFPPENMRLWTGTWKWVTYEVTEAEQAAALAERGVEFVETMAIGDMLRHPLFST